MAKGDKKADGGADGKKSGSKIKTVAIIVVAAVLAAVLSVVGTLYFLTEGDPSAEEDQTEEVPAAASYITFERPLVVGIEGEGRQRYLQVYLALVTRDDDSVDEVERHMPAIRSRFQSVLQREDYDVLYTDEGKIELQATLLAAVNEVLEQEGVAPVEKVLFTNFVMQ